MSRISRAETKSRESYLRQYFRDHPKATGLEANEALKKKVGQKMAAKRVYQIKAQMAARSPSAIIETKPSNTEKPITQERSRFVVEGTPDQIHWLENVLKQLKKSNRVNVEFAATDGDFAVLQFMN